MFYLLFRYSLGAQKKVYQEFKSKEDVIKFIKEKRGKIEIEKVIEAGREFKLNWILKLDEIDKPSPQRRGRPRKEEKKAEPEQVDQEEPDKEEIEVAKNLEETDEGKLGRTLDRGEKAIEAAKKEQEDKIIKWELCSVCEKNRVVSSNKRKICGECLQKEKKRTSDKRKKEILLSSETRTNKSKESE